jgi:nickel-dependent lactate racemase
MSNKWKKVKKLAGDVAKATANIAQIAASLASGNLDASSTATVTFVKYNYDVSTGSAVSSFDLGDALDIASGVAQVTCTECYAYAATSLHVSIDIESYALKTVEVYVSGDVSFKMDMGGTMINVAQEWEKEV